QHDVHAVSDGGAAFRALRAALHRIFLRRGPRSVAARRPIVAAGQRANGAHRPPQRERGREGRRRGGGNDAGESSLHHDAHARPDVAYGSRAAGGRRAAADGGGADAPERVARAAGGSARQAARREAPAPERGSVIATLARRLPESARRALYAWSRRFVDACDGANDADMSTNGEYRLLGEMMPRCRV